MKTDISLKILRFFFILCGGKFYLDWILPTNPASKNPLWKRLWAMTPHYNDMADPSERLIFSIWSGATHSVGFIVLMVTSGSWWMNALVNAYPIIVQVYIGLRCWKIKRHKSEIKCAVAVQ